MKRCKKLDNELSSKRPKTKEKDTKNSPSMAHMPEKERKAAVTYKTERKQTVSSKTNIKLPEIKLKEFEGDH